MGNKPNKPAHPLCGVCHKGVELLTDAAGDAACEEAIGIMEGACQGIAASNMLDGIGETIEPVCGVLGVAGTVACVSATHMGAPNKWKDILKDKACHSVGLCG